MLSPGMGELAARLITGVIDDRDKDVITVFSPSRPFSEGHEALR
jgi:hypothetical protein